MQGRNCSRLLTGEAGSEYVTFRNITSNSLPGQRAMVFPSRNPAVHTSPLQWGRFPGATTVPTWPPLCIWELYCIGLYPECWQHLSLSVSQTDRLTGPADAVSITHGFYAAVCQVSHLPGSAVVSLCEQGKLCVCAKSLQLCPTLCNAMDCSPPGSSVHGILQARTLEWVAMRSSWGSCLPRDGTCISMSLALAQGSLPLAPPEESQGLLISKVPPKGCRHGSGAGLYS